MINTLTRKPLKYGVLSDGAVAGARMPTCVLKPSEVFKDQSGNFVKPDGTDDFAVAGSGDALLTGWAVTHDHTVDASVEERAEIVTDFNARFLMPADGAVTEAKKGLTCDLIVSANIQQADVGESNEDVIVIYDINVALQLVEVGLNPAKMWASGVA